MDDNETCVYHDDRRAEIKEIKENIKELFGKVNEQWGDKKAMEVVLKDISKRFDSLLTFMYVIGGAGSNKANFYNNDKRI